MGFWVGHAVVVGVVGLADGLAVGLTVGFAVGVAVAMLGKKGAKKACDDGGKAYKHADLSCRVLRGYTSRKSRGIERERERETRERARERGGRERGKGPGKGRLRT